MATDPELVNSLDVSPVEWEKASRRFSHCAMATTYEIFIVHPDQEYAQQAAWAAFERLDQLEQELSRFIPGSDISRINTLVANQSIIIGLDAFHCLQIAADVYQDTNGAFDVTFGTAVDLSASHSHLLPMDSRTGLDSILLNEADHSLTLLNGPISIDLGGIGKGYALDQMAAILQEWEADTALLHSGCSTALALEAPPGTKGWRITISEPKPEGRRLKQINLRRRAFSGSGICKGPHIIDPRTLLPVAQNRAAWSGAETGALADALSTAFMVMTWEELEQFHQRFPDILMAVWEA